MRSKVHPLAKVVAVANLFCEYAIQNPNSDGMNAERALSKIRQLHSGALDEAAVSALAMVVKNGS